MTPPPSPPAPPSPPPGPFARVARALAGMAGLVATVLAAWLMVAPGAEPPARARPWRNAQPAPELRSLAPQQVTVEAVGDGDSVHVRQGQRRFTVRLACIDAPELDQSPEGRQSRAYLRSRLRPGSAVTLLPKAIDPHGRLVAELIQEDNLNLALVEEGQAFVYSRHVGQCDAREYRAAELRASRRHSGIWQIPGGSERPWDHRHRRGRRLPEKPSGG